LWHTAISNNKTAQYCEKSQKRKYRFPGDDSQGDVKFVAVVHTMHASHGIIMKCSSNTVTRKICQTSAEILRGRLLRVVQLQP